LNEHASVAAEAGRSSLSRDTRSNAKRNCVRPSLKSAKPSNQNDDLVEFFSFNAADDVSNVSFEGDCLA